MMNYKIVLSGIALGVATLLTAPATAALLFSDSDSFENILTELTGGPKLSVSRYDGGGIVNDIKLTFSSALRTSGEIVNTAAQAQDFSLTLFAGQYDLVPAAGSPVALPTFSALTLDSPFGQTIGSQAYVALAPDTLTPFGEFEVTGDESLSITDITAIADFIGTGDITFEPFTQILTLGQGGGGNVDTFVDTVADGTLTIEYFGAPPVTSPTSVPEPSVMGGMVALGALGLRKKLKRQVS
ncbi:MAG: choice-of-anchor E domain-containing protein [Cyanobacteria bacterium P01_F01_bin.53]